VVFLDPRPRAPVHVDGLCIKPPRVHPLSLLFCSSLSRSAQLSSAQQQLNHSAHYTLHTTHYTLHYTHYPLSTTHQTSSLSALSATVSSLSSCQLQLYYPLARSPARRSSLVPPCRLKPSHALSSAIPARFAAPQPRIGARAASQSGTAQKTTSTRFVSPLSLSRLSPYAY